MVTRIFTDRSVADIIRVTSFVGVLDELVTDDMLGNPWDVEAGIALTSEEYLHSCRGRMVMDT